MISIGDTLYRCDSINVYGGVEVFVTEYKVTSLTPKGCYIDFYGEQKWVSSEHRKRYAYPSEKEALISFRARKKRQIEILTGQLGHAKLAIVCGINTSLRNGVVTFEVFDK